MLEHFALIKNLHIAAAIGSGALFLVRGAFVQAGSAWPMIAPLRYLSYAIDTVLLAAAVALVLLLPGEVFSNGWLTTKLILLVGYIVLGSIALKRGKTRLARRLAYVLAILVFLSMYSIARRHDPLGPFLLIRDYLT